MQLNADFGAAGKHGFAQPFRCPRRSGDRIIDQKDRFDPEPFAELQEFPQRGNGVDAVAVAGQRRAPIEFLFGVDGDDELLPEPFAKANEVGGCGRAIDANVGQVRAFLQMPLAITRR